jgi:hypothetical protein
MVNAAAGMMVQFPRLHGQALEFSGSQAIADEVIRVILS